MGMREGNGGGMKMMGRTPPSPPPPPGFDEQDFTALRAGGAEVKLMPPPGMIDMPPPPPLDEDDDEFAHASKKAQSKTSFVVPPPPPPPTSQSSRRRSSAKRMSVPPPPPLEPESLPVKQEPIAPPKEQMSRIAPPASPRVITAKAKPSVSQQDQPVVPEWTSKQEKRGSRKSILASSRASLKDRIAKIVQKKVDDGPPEDAPVDAYQEPKPLSRDEKQQVLGRALGSMMEESPVKLMKNVISQLQLRQVEDPTEVEEVEDLAKKPASSSPRSSKRQSALTSRRLGPLYGVCAGCSKTVRTASHFFTPNGDIWHTGCVECSHCKKSAKDVNFLIVNGKLYCEESFNDLFNRKCACCNEIADPADLLIETVQSVFHPRCFSCQTCGKDLAQITGSVLKTEEFIIDSNGQLQCPTHVSKHTCYGCGEAIAINEPGSLQAKLVASEEPRSFHSRCFACKVCQKSISELGGGYIVHQGEIYCSKDYTESLQMFCSGCTKPISPTSSYLLAFDSEKYHTACFQCTKCKERKDGMFLDDDGKLICPDCES